ncbi:hypothetical protein Aca07nite_68570 [Actinoplanes capillaceus]|uniref:Uncharacterized protein n=1 Tax=Actinoplanes campanulatus TaxID=113559 RepID=A0ABQ3WTH5_9ACTN|nr:hypothetical protein [Actinoplanes capillaceus]GID49582.1 hypothetical protein Aca07nite_68570 [Actinoplanes capillaceus]
MINLHVRSYRDRMAGYRRVLEARSPETTLDRLRELAGDEIRPVRLWTARNPRTPADALARLLQDADESVQGNALLHTGTPGTALEWLADEEETQYGFCHFSCRSLIVHHPNTPGPLRRRLLDAGACSCPNWCGGRIPFRHQTEQK